MESISTSDRRLSLFGTIAMTSANDPYEKSDDNLTYRLFLQLISTSYQSLSSALGPEEAKRAIRPYFENSGKAGYHNVAANLQTQESERLMHFWLWANHGVTRSCVKAAFGPNKVMLENDRCPLEGRIPEFCNGFCQVAAEACAREVWPECNFSQIPADDTNDHRCRWSAFTTSGTSPSNELVEKDASSILRELPPEQFEWLAKSISGEFWVIATRAVLDSLDEQQASPMFLESMKKSGGEFVMQNKVGHEAKGEGIKSALTFVQSINAIQQQKGQIVSSTPEMVTVEIHECPYADAPPLLCREYEAFLNGACAQIDPGLLFKYHQMMTRGDKHCTWSISRKNGEKKSADEDHPKMILMRRLARGEITIKEYEELRNYLSTELKETTR